MVIRHFLNAGVKRVVVVLFLNFEFKVRVSHIKVKINRKERSVLVHFYSIKAYTVCPSVPQFLCTY